MTDLVGPIKLARGLEAAILALTGEEQGQPFYSTDTKKFFIVDGTGVPVEVSPPVGVRSTVTYTTASLAAGATEDASLTVPLAYSILRAETDFPARLRLYMSSAKRTADAARLVTADPVGDHGCILETVHVVGVLGLSLTPVAIGFDPAAGTTVYLSIVNNDTVARAITVMLNVLSMES